MKSLILIALAGYAVLAGCASNGEGGPGHTNGKLQGHHRKGDRIVV